MILARGRPFCFRRQGLCCGFDVVSDARWRKQDAALQNGDPRTALLLVDIELRANGADLRVAAPNDEGPSAILGNAEQSLPFEHFDAPLILGERYFQFRPRVQLDT